MFASTVQFPWATEHDDSATGTRTDPGGASVFPMAATLSEFLTTRLRNQQLIESTRRKAAQVVSWFGAMQAQDFPGAIWALGLRIPGSHTSDVEQAFDDGAILRTHVLRPTWHFVTPEDIRWMLALSAPRVHAANAYYYRQAGLDAKIFLKSCAMIHRTLEGGQFLTRAELAVYLKRAKLPADGLKLGYLMMHAELEGVICSGPRKSKQFTYALLDERAPAGRTYSRDEAIAELTTRYFASHGPATIRDFAWWSGLTMKDVRLGIESAGSSLVEETFDGCQYYSAPGKAAPARKIGGAFLLPNYDEYFIAYKDRSQTVDADRAANIVARTGGAFANHLVIDGRLAGGWSRTIKGNSAVIEIAPYKKLTPAQTRAVAGAVDCYGEFLGLPAILSIG